MSFLQGSDIRYINNTPGKIPHWAGVRQHTLDAMILWIFLREKINMKLGGSGGEEESGKN